MTTLPCPHRPTLRSMTGYGRAHAQSGSLSLQVQVSSLNSRQLELHLSAPRGWQGLEQALRQVLRGRVHRGRLHVSITAQSAAPAAWEAPLWDGPRLKAQLEQLGTFCAQAGVPFAPDATLVLALQRFLAESAVPGALLAPGSASSLALGPPAEAPAEEDGGGAPVWEAHQELLLAALEGALEQLLAMRAKEGAALVQDALTHVSTLEGLWLQMETLKEQVLPYHRERWLKRLQEAGLSLDPSDERVLKELALFADRCDISEELARLHSHLGQLRQSLAHPEEAPMGRKLDFLCQEVGRELTTLGNKANFLALQQAALEAKNTLEKIREQVQNIE